MIHSTTLLGDGEYLVRVDEEDLQWTEQVTENIGKFYVLERGWLAEDEGKGIIAFKVKVLASYINGWDVMPDYSVADAPYTLDPNHKINEQ